MDPRDIAKLRALTGFPALVAYLRDELDWPIEVEDARDVTFDYDPAELGIDPQYAVKIESIKQVRPLVDTQPWGVFYIEFESKRLPVVVLRRILRSLVPASRRRAPEQPIWPMDDLLFISAFGDAAAGQREIAFAHFHQETGDLPTLRVLGWDGADTPLKLDHVAATLKERLKWPRDPGDLDTWRRQWSGAFRHRLGHVIRTADALADRLAVLARGIRDAARTLMDHESERGPLRRLHKAFQTALIHDLSEADFADTYAQTITYGLLTAAISRTEMSEGRYGTALVAENVTDMVPITNPFLREMLQTFLQAGGRRGGIDFDELGIQDVVELLRGDETDLPAILRDFGNRTLHEDPVIYFYEYFAKRYDPQEKIRRGEFYTPQPVVSYIVRSVHELLQTEFGLEDGLASTVTWDEMAKRHAGLAIPAGVAPDSPFVQILDPATGTATFLVEVIDVIHRTLTAKWKQQRLTEAQQRAAWNDYVPKHLLPRVHGFELKMAPYAIAHMRVGLKLQETRFTAWEKLNPIIDRVRVYLTNTLEPPFDGGKQMAFAEWAPALAHEAQAVNAIKSRQRFTVVIGNPPYSVSSANRGEFIENLMERYKVAVRQEHNIQPLSDDYIKFIRYTHDCIECAGYGAIGMITNHAYLTGLVHRGMREELMGSFSETLILDLHGNAVIGEMTPDNGKDENVFDIRQGVALVFMIKKQARRESSNVQHADLWGLRNAKYRYLLGSDISTTNWLTLRPTPPYFFFVPKDFNLAKEYEQGWSTTQVFRLYQRGVATRRDHFMVAFDRDELESRFRTFGSNASDERISEEFDVHTTEYWNLGQARSIVRQRGSIAKDIVPYAYRPFDTRAVAYIPELIERGDAAYGVMQYMLHPNTAIICFRRIRDEIPHRVFIANQLVDKTFLSPRDNMTAFPLYVYVEPQTNQAALFGTETVIRESNLSLKFVAAIKEKLRLNFVLQGMGDLQRTFGPENILHYAYAVFQSPTYQVRYAEFLKIDFPRLPLTSNPELFRALARLGGELVALHLMESPRLDRHLTTYTGPAHPEVEKVSYARNSVWLDKAQTCGFRGVPEAVWAFHIGGYQVCEKWLKDRKGRVLSPEDIEHYQRIVVALAETIRLMGEIDEVIEQHGGWPMK
jgi:hypothetical protein